MNKERIIYLDVLRIISIFSVIIIHVAAMDWYTSPIDSLAWQSVNVYHAVTRFCVPVMFMISGALFLSGEREIKLNRLWSKNICRIVMAFVFWSALYAAPYWLNMTIRHMAINKHTVPCGQIVPFSVISKDTTAANHLKEQERIQTCTRGFVRLESD